MGDCPTQQRGGHGDNVGQVLCVGRSQLGQAGDISVGFLSAV